MRANKNSVGIFCWKAVTVTYWLPFGEGGYSHMRYDETGDKLSEIGHWLPICGSRTETTGFRRTIHVSQTKRFRRWKSTLYPKEWRLRPTSAGSTLTSNFSIHAQNCVRKFSKRLTKICSHWKSWKKNRKNLVWKSHILTLFAIKGGAGLFASKLCQQSGRNSCYGPSSNSVQLFGEIWAILLGPNHYLWETVEQKSKNRI